MTDRAPNSKKIKSLDTSLGADYTDCDNLETDIESAIFQLEMVHIEIDKLNDKENDEILVIEQKYKKLKQHYFQRRSEVIETIPDFWSTVVSFFYVILLLPPKLSFGIIDVCSPSWS